MKPETVNVTCPKCGMAMPVPVGGKRLCGCGTWISGVVPAATAMPVATAEAIPVEMDLPPTRQPGARPGPVAAPAEAFPRIEGELAAIERLNDGYRRILKELGKAI